MANGDTLDDLAGQEQIDSRDLYERLDELQMMVDDADDEDEPKPDAVSDEERAELAELKALQSETEGYSGDTWRDGVQFIRDDWFEQYAEEFADDIGAIDKDANWPVNHIDWKAAADDLRQDYTEVEIRGISYQYR